MPNEFDDDNYDRLIWDVRIAIKAMPGEVVDLNGKNITDKDLLKVVWVMNKMRNELKDFGKNKLFLHGNNFDEENINDQGMIALAKFLEDDQVFETVNFTWNTISEPAGKALAKALRRNKKLEKLILFQTSINDVVASDMIKALDENNTLKVLNIKENQINVKIFEELLVTLLNNYGLTELNIEGFRFELNPELREKLAQVQYIKRVIMGQNFTIVGIPELARDETEYLERTTFISLEKRYNKNSTEIKFIADHKHLVSFEILLLSRILREYKNLKTLDLSFNKLLGINGEVLSEWLITNSTLEHLNLCSCRLGDVGGSFIAQTLNTNRTLTILDFSGNNLGMQTARDLGKVLAVNNKLRELYLGSNNLEDDSGVEIVRSLRTNTILTRISFSDNKLGERTAKEIAEVLKTNRSLTYLNISNNNLGDSGEDIANAIKENTSLTNLYLISCQLTKESVMALANALDKNKTLTKIDISYNVFDGEIRKAFAKVIYKKSQMNLKFQFVNDLPLPELTAEEKKLIDEEIIRERQTPAVQAAAASATPAKPRVTQEIRETDV